MHARCTDRVHDHHARAGRWSRGGHIISSSLCSGAACHWSASPHDTKVRCTNGSYGLLASMLRRLCGFPGFALRKGKDARGLFEVGESGLQKISARRCPDKCQSLPYDEQHLSRKAWGCTRGSRSERAAHSPASTEDCEPTWTNWASV